ncbi:MAG: DsrE/DsrF/DrsH-like family protein [Deltaproteobacteria bacterium]|nr:DsrE/DsrF/DrsH-like family protein [Deltaproteobacteria bacterium]
MQSTATPVLHAAPRADAEPTRKVAIICSKGTLDMAYPGLILGNAARMSGIDVMMFFTFWGLEIIQKKRAAALRVPTVGNPSMHIPTMLGGLPGMEAMATKMMARGMKKLDIPDVPEMLQILADAGAKLYACGMAMDMFKLTKDDLVPQIEGVLTAIDFFDKAEGAQIIFI